MRVLDMDMAEPDGQESAKAILFNGTNPRNENERTRLFRCCIQAR